MKRKAESEVKDESGPPPYKTLGRLSREPRLAGKVALITGGSRGFGRAIAVRFIEEGAKVAICARGSCEDTLAEIQAIEGVGSENINKLALAVKCDLSDEKSIETMVEAVTTHFGSLHILINNAAAFVFKNIENCEAADWDKICGVNIRGTAMVTKHCVPHLKKAGGGSIVMQGSISSFLAQPNCVTYSVTKAAIVQMAKNSAMDLAKYNIRVNSICAGTIETPISAVERRDQGWTYAEWEKLKVKDVMMGRVGNVREIANATLFYASDESSYCTGGHLMVDGGQTWCTVMP